MGGAIAGGSALADPPQDAYGHGYGMGGGMMGGFGMGADGMMDGQGRGYGMGSGMMGGYGSRADLHLTSEQRSKIAKIQDDVRRKHWDLMGKMQDERPRMNEQYNVDPRDDAALSMSYLKMSELRQQMFDLFPRRPEVDSVLTAEQREKMKHA